MGSNNDHKVWVYHALHDPKVVNFSEAQKLYKQGWRNSPDPKILFKGIRGKCYKLIIVFKKLFSEPKQLSPLKWIGLLGSVASIVGLVIMFL